MIRQHRALAALLLVCLLAGCGGGEAPQRPGTQQPAQEIGMGEPVRTIPVAGFDPEGEPIIDELSDGSLRVMFEFMPPSFAEDETELGPFENFDEQMQQAIGVPVLWEDRELFLIRNPKPDTIERLQQFLQNYRESREPHRAPMEQQ